MVSLSTSISLKTLSNPKDTKATQKTKKSKKTKQKRAAATTKQNKTTTTTTTTTSYSSTALVYNNLADQKLQGSRTSFQAREREREREREKRKKEREIQGKHSCNHTTPESLSKPSSSNNNSNNKPISFYTSTQFWVCANNMIVLLFSFFFPNLAKV
jgi:hypothetical protein